MIRVHRLRNATLTTEEGMGAVRPPAEGERAWFVVVEPTPEEAKAVVDALPFHELAMEDALGEGHPPKVEDFDDHVFFIVHTPGGDLESSTRKIAVFLGKTWLASVQRVPFGYADDVEARVLKEPERFLGAPERIAHALLDHMLDGFEHLADEFVDGAEALEDAMLDSPDPAVLSELLQKRQDVNRFLRLMRAQRDVAQTISRSTHPVFSPRIRPYLRDVYDHSLRVYDLLEGVRESLSTAREGYLSAVNNRLSETMRVLTVIATLMMPLSLIAGIFGMNFESLPLARWSPGFWACVGVMLGIAVGMLLWFRRRNWI